MKKNLSEMKCTNFQIEKAQGMSITVNEKRSAANSNMKFQNTREQKENQKLLERNTSYTKESNWKLEDNKGITSKFSENDFPPRIPYLEKLTIKCEGRASLVARWLRIRLPMQGTRV